MRDILDPQDRWLGAPVGFVSSSNKAPVAIDDTLAVAMDSGPVTIDVLANDFDPEGAPLSLVYASAGLGTAVAEPNNTVTYTPPAGISGFDTIVYEVADDLDQRQIAQVNVTITGQALSLTTLQDNTMEIDAAAAPLDLTITEPAQWAGTYNLDIADLTGGPLNIAPPTVAGDVTAGQVLTASGGLWINDTSEVPLTQTWQWRSNGADISGATQSTYTVQSGDVGQVISVAEAQSDAAGQREATAQAASSQTFGPALDAGLLGWWDASDLGTISEQSGGVANWTDKAGAGALIQDSAALRPLTGTRQLNGLNVIDFDGSHYLADATRVLPGSGDVAFHMALAIDSTSNAFEALLALEATNDFQLDANNNTQFDGRLNSAGIGTSVNLTGGPFSGGLIFTLVFDRTGSATAEVFVADASRGTTDYSVPLDANTTLLLMANRALNARANGAVAELILTSTLNNRADYHAYLAAKWGLV